MRPNLTAVVVIALSTALLPAGEPETLPLQRLNQEPARFDGKTVQVRAQVSGTLVEKPKWILLTVKTKAVTVEGKHLNRKGINFVIAKGDKEQLTRGLQPNKIRHATITATVKKQGAAFLAVVSAIEFHHQNKPASNNPKTMAVISEGVGRTSEEALKDAFRNAVRQVVGALVDAETVVKNDEVISDKVLTLSGGIVKHYEEVSSRHDKGLVRKKIKAQVERGAVVEKLRESNVAFKDVDGKDIAGEVETELGRDKEAKALLTKRLQEYRASIVRAEPVGEPRVSQKGEEATTIEYDIRLSADPVKYDALRKNLLPVLRRGASAKGEVRLSASAVTWNLHNEESWSISEGAAFIGKASGIMSLPRLENTKPGGFGPIWMASYDSVWIEENGTRRKRSKDLHLIVMCTKRTKLNDRLTWEWFLVPKTDDERCSVCVHVSVVDKQENEITSNDIPLSSFKMPGLYQVKADDQVGDLVLAPYLLRLGTWGGAWDGDRIAADLTVKIKSRVATSDLRRIKGIQCRVEVKEQTRNSND